MNKTNLDDMIRGVEESLKFRALDFYTPYAKQKAFHDAGGQLDVKERLFMAGNQLGKTLSASRETAYHMTGLYPSWWKGRIFPMATSGWCGSPTGQTARDTVQRLLLGRPGQIGTGAIPKHLIVDLKRAAGNVPDLYETIYVKHRLGGISTATIKTYDQGRARWQGETLHWVWLDEESEADIYSEAVTRTNATNGIVYLTFTPLLGMSNVVLRFLKKRAPGTHVTTMTIHEAGHYTEAERAKIIATYPEHEREARALGVPMLGSGRVFTTDEKVIAEVPTPMPGFWPRLAALDIGYDHPTAVVWGAWDRDTDTVHLYDAYRVAKGLISTHAASIASRGKWIPVAWPHDAEIHDKSSGIIVAKQYRDLGVNMLPQKATHAPERGKLEGTGGFGFEAGIMDMERRLSEGRLKVARHLSDWFDEYRMYHREDGKVVKVDDDLMSATRILLMMLRHAKTAEVKRVATLPGVSHYDPSMGALG